MKFLLLVLSALLFGHLSSLAQLQNNDTSSAYYRKLYQSVQETYGIDQLLANGIFYEDKYPNQSSHPFLFEGQFYAGTITLRGKEYTGIDLKYDLFEQQLVLYINYNNSITWIIPPNDFISDFELNGKHFTKYNYQGESRFFQVVYDYEEFKCLYYWSKSKYDADRSGLFNKVEFKNNPRKSYLVLDGKFFKYRNNNSFTKLLPRDIKPGVKNYLESQKIKVARCTDNTMIELLTFCNSLLKH